jgi:hypothetical protein
MTAGPAQQSSGLAITSLVLGICGIVLCLGPIAGIPAVICGHIAHSKIKRSGGAMTGSGAATAGLITGYISIAMVVVTAMLAAIAIPNFVKARKQAFYSVCQINLQTIQEAKEAWARDSGKADDSVPQEADLLTGSKRYLREMPQCREGGTYTFNAVRENPTCTLHGTIGSPGP